MIVKVRVHDEDNLYNSFMQQETEEINLNMPIKYLTTKELLVIIINTTYGISIYNLFMHAKVIGIYGIMHITNQKI